MSIVRSAPSRPNSRCSPCRQASRPVTCALLITKCERPFRSRGHRLCCTTPPDSSSSAPIGRSANRSRARQTPKCTTASSPPANRRFPICLWAPSCAGRSWWWECRSSAPGRSPTCSRWVSGRRFYPGCCKIRTSRPTGPQRSSTAEVSSSRATGNSAAFSASPRRRCSGRRWQGKLTAGSPMSRVKGFRFIPPFGARRLPAGP